MSFDLSKVKSILTVVLFEVEGLEGKLPFLVMFNNTPFTKGVYFRLKPNGFTWFGVDGCRLNSNSCFPVTISNKTDLVSVTRRFSVIENDVTVDRVENFLIEPWRCGVKFAVEEFYLEIGRFFSLRLHMA